MFARSIRAAKMTRSSRAAAQRAAAITRHMSSSTPASSESDEPPVLFKANGSLREYILNRPQKLNALNEPMLDTLRPKIEEWSQGELPGVVVGTGVGRAFCAGGDVEGVIRAAENPDTLPKAISFFHREFELDYILATMPKPYVVIMDGITMGGGVGLSVNAPFRIATENTLFAMPETKIGYCPDVGASYFLSRVDGQVGTYLGLTSETLKGRAVFEHGFATHFVPARRIPALLERLASLENPTYQQIDSTIEEHRAERLPGELESPLTGTLRVAIDQAFGHNSVEEIFAELEGLATGSEHEDVRVWAKTTLEMLKMRSPTSLKVALQAVRRGESMTLLEALQMEMNIATAFCHGASPDFHTGVTAVLVTKTKGRPQWSPSTLEEVKDSFILKSFFADYSPEVGTAPTVTSPPYLADVEPPKSPMRFALPPEDEIQQFVEGSHRSSGSTVLTLEELIERCEATRPGKAGVREKVLEVVKRKCVPEEDKHLGKRWLKWLH